MTFDSPESPLRSMSADDVDAVLTSIRAGGNPMQESATTGAPDERWSAHALLQQFAGRIPDVLMYRVRLLLVNSSSVDAARLLARILVESQVPMTSIEATAIAELLDAVARAEYAPRMAVLAEEWQPAPYVFIDERPGPVTRISAHPYRRWAQDLSDPDDAGRDVDDVDAAVIDAVSQVPEAIGLWRAWRFGPGGLGEEPIGIEEDGPNRCFLVVVSRHPGEGAQPDDLDLLNALPDLTIQLQRPAAQEEPMSLLEVGVDASGCAYQDRLWSAGALLWTRVARRQIDVLTGDAPGAGNATVVPEAERAPLVEYLDSGRVVMVETVDTLPPSNPEFERVAVHTDGDVVWAGSINRDLEDGLPVRADFLAYVRERAAQSPRIAPVDGVTAHRALRAYLDRRFAVHALFGV